jgi:ABC-2 type transport system permease protein
MKRNLHVIYARFLLGLKLYFRYPVNILNTLFDPLMWLTPFYFMGKAFMKGGTLTGFEKYTGNSNFIGFLVVGYIVSSFVGTVFWSLGFSLQDEMRSGVLESNWSAPVNRIVLLLGKCLFSFCTTTFEVILACIVCHFAFGFTMNSQILRALVFLIPGIIGLLGLGIAISALVLIAKNANPIIDLSNAILMALSGGYFPVKVMSKGFYFFALALPLTYIYDSMRAVLINQAPLFPLNKEFIIIVVSMVFFCILGNFVFNKVEKRCRTLGILGTH